MINYIRIVTLAIIASSAQPVTAQQETLQDLMVLAEKSSANTLNQIKPLETSVQNLAHEMGTTLGYNHRANYWRDSVNAVAFEYDDILNFSAYLVKTESGKLVLPPVVTEYGAADRVSADRQTLEDLEVRYRVIRPGRLTLVPPTWRDFLTMPKRKLREMDPAAAPTTSKLREIWKKASQAGWQFGVTLADRDFNRRMRRLEEEFVGYINYHKLVSLGMINKLHIQEETRGIEIDRNSLSIGGTIVTISRDMQFNRRTNEWKPILIRRKGKS